jgi:transposase
MAVHGDYSYTKELQNQVVKLRVALEKRRPQTMVDEAGKKIDELIEKKRKLEEQGIHDGGYWMKDGKYLYKVSRSSNGYQERTYIGSDEEKIREAEAEGTRYKEWLKVCEQLRTWEPRLERVLRQIGYIADNLDITKQGRMF